MWVCDGENSYILLVGMKVSTTTMEITMEIPQDTKTTLPYDPTISLLGKYLKKSKRVWTEIPARPYLLQYYP
jgi:hypothetical protein